MTLGPKQRTLLIILVLHGGGYVSADRIVEWLYEGDAPGDAHKSLQVHVSRLRKALRDGYVKTLPGGYGFELDRIKLDSASFDTLADVGRAQLGRGRRGGRGRDVARRAVTCGGARRLPSSHTPTSPKSRSPASRSVGWLHSRTASRRT